MLSSHEAVAGWARDFARRYGARVKTAGRTGKRGRLILRRGNVPVMINYDLPLHEADLRAEMANLLDELLPRR